MWLRTKPRRYHRLGIGGLTCAEGHYAFALDFPFVDATDAGTGGAETANESNHGPVTEDGGENLD